MPTYAALLYQPVEDEGPATPEEWDAVMAEYDEFSEKAGAAGVIVGGEALHDTPTATTVHLEGGKGGTVVTTDGPFAETKEVLGGFFLLKCKDLDEAVHWASQIPAAWHGKVEVRPCIEFPDAE